MDESSTVIKSKVVLCGDFRVGKTSLRKNFMGQSFNAQYMQTLGIDISTVELDFGDDTSFILQIWDFSGQPAFQFIRKKFLLGVSGILYVFDQTRAETLSNLTKWVDEIRIGTEDKDLPVILLGNKVDLDEVSINQGDVTEFINGLDQNTFVGYYQTSAKTGKNVNECFTSLAKAIYEGFNPSI
ncbi:MAG: Rab family GTPase [Candidatus Kariarchaeaceae archaeon]|jgi:small GTP-binding protein